MKTIFKLAWRNIWRNKRRTFITMASILFAVLFASFMEALQRGAWDNMIANVVNYYYGYAQIHQKGYWEEQTLDKAFVWNDQLQALDAEVPKIQAVVPRIESFALASHGNNTSGVLVVGIDPVVETRMTNLESRITQGSYLSGDDQAALIADGIAENLGLRLGDTLVLISQGYHGANAAGKFPIKGIIHFASPDLNKMMVYLPLKAAQYFFRADNLLTTLALQIKDQGDIAPAIKAVRSKLGTTDYEIMDWKELLPDLLKAKQVDAAGNYVVFVILYAIIAFGVFGTILMMAKEREYEFGILLSIGMRRFQLAATIWVEIILLGVLGALAGIFVSVPLVFYFNRNPIQLSGNYATMLEKYGFEPIFPAALDADIFLTQALVVFLITAVIALYPFFKIRKVNPVQAMRD